MSCTIWINLAGMPNDAQYRCITLRHVSRGVDVGGGSQ
jgi:hypothetical protein